MTKHQLLNIISKLRVWKQGGKRAPHKPLLILIAISCIQHDKKRLILFSEIEEHLTSLLKEFGPKRPTYCPEEPFCRLRTDGIWELSTKVDAILPKGSFSKTTLRKNAVKGGFTQEVHSLIRSTPDVMQQIIHILLKANFPSTIHQDILDAVGIDSKISLQTNTTTKNDRKRDPRFRERILQAYNYRCAICGFDVRLGNIPIALEAAHIMWHQAGGPDTENNGLALCVLHHKLLDRGALAISNDFKIIISDKANGYIGFQEWLLNFQDKELRAPQKQNYKLNTKFTNWHIKEVFQGEYRS